MSQEKYLNFIGGEWVSSPTVSKNINPSDTSDVIAEYVQADKSQTESAIESAHGSKPIGLVTTHKHDLMHWI